MLMPASLRERQRDGPRWDGPGGRLGTAAPQGLVGTGPPDQGRIEAKRPAARPSDSALPSLWAADFITRVAVDEGAGGGPPPAPGNRSRPGGAANGAPSRFGPR